MDNHFQQSPFSPMGSQQAQQAQQQQQQQQQQHHQPSFSSYPAVQGGHQPSNQAHEHSTLPPLQPASHGYGHLPPIYTGGPTSASPHPPPTPGVNSASAHTPTNFSAMPTPVPAGSMPPPSTTYMAPAPGYATTQPPSAGGHTQSTHAPANRLQDIRPMPPGGGFNSPMSPFPPFNNAAAMAHGGQPHQYIPSQEPEPTHVVGSQGRRGILPSVPGRAPAPGPSSNAVSAKSLIPIKDADGKFPCPHCNKTYLHAKHLKRHLLRHTGDRPYMCHLCKDTFSRSDILKRHFQKCSIRRGNPTGANHLAGQRRNTGGSTGPRLSMGQADQPIGLAGLSDIQTPTSFNGSMPNTVNGSPTVGGESSYASSMASMSNRSSRANSLIQPPGAFGVPTLPSSGQNGNHHHPVTSAPFHSGVPTYGMRAHSASNPVHPSAYGYGAPAGDGHMYGSGKENHPGNNYTAQSASSQQQQGRQNGNMDWNNVFDANGFMGQGPQDQSQVPKSEHPMEGQSFDSTNSYQNSFLNGVHNATGGYGDNGAHANGLALVTR